MSFLFPKVPLQAPIRDPDGSWAFFGGDLKTYFISSDKDHYSSRQVFKKNSKFTGNGKESIATPPYHWHVYQTETFEVNGGRMCYILNGQEGKLEKGQSVAIPPHAYHTFWPDPEIDEDLNVNVTVRGGPNPGFDEEFVHNFYGYLSSCMMQNKAPSPFQLLAFLDSADVVLADVPLGAGRLANIVFGRWIGQYIGGYQVSYKEFSKESR